MGHARINRFSSPEVELVYARHASGRIVHISEVASGIGCDCFCPACGRMLVAKKGEEKAHHFSHRANISCVAAAETALRRLAKQIVEDNQRLWLPEVTACFGESKCRIHRAGRVSFTRVIAEATHLKSVVPDLFVEKDGHLLLVEILVTHACDEEKIARLRQRKIATVEIDLSEVPRDANRLTVERAVLSEAPRHWVYHPRIDAAVAEMTADAKRKQAAAAEKLANEAKVLKRAYLEGVADIAKREARSPDPRDEIVRAGLAGHIGMAVDGIGCFTVPAHEWQWAIFKEFISPKEGLGSGFQPGPIVDYFKSKNLIRKRFCYVAPEVEQLLIAAGIGFLSPYRAVEKYLDVLVAREVLVDVTIYHLLPEFVSRLHNIRQAERRHRERIKDLLSRCLKILDALPFSEVTKFDMKAWMHMIQDCGISFLVAIQNDDRRLRDMLGALSQIEEMIFRKGAICEVSLHLPVAAERERQRAAREKEAAERERERREAEASARQQRIARLTEEAVSLGEDAESWINTVSARLGGAPPLVLAGADDTGLWKAIEEIGREVRRRQLQMERENAIADFQDQLRQATIRILGEKAQPFLVSPYPELGRKRPIDYCASAETLKICLDLAHKVRRGRR